MRPWLKKCIRLLHFNMPILLQHAYPIPTCQNRRLDPRFSTQKLIFVLWRGLCEVCLTNPASEVCVVGGCTKSDPEDSDSRGVPVTSENFDPDHDSGCVRMPSGVATRTQSARVWGHTPNKIDIGVLLKHTKIGRTHPKMCVFVCVFMCVF